jgi:predicted PurR-regulated permease PerM
MLKLFSKDQTVSISPSIVVFTTFFLLFLYFLYQIASILVLFFLGFIVMVALNPLVRRLEVKLRFPHLLAIATAYLLVFLLVAGMVGFVVPPLLNQLITLIRALNLPFLSTGFDYQGFTLNDVSAIMDQLGQSVTTIYAFLTSTFGGVFTFTTVLVISLYLMLDRQRLHLRLSWFTNNKKHLQTAKEFVDSLEYQLGGWIRGQLILMVTIGVVTYVGLSLLSVPYAAPLALMAALLEILPNLGPTLSAIPSIALAFFMMGPVMGLVVFVFYVLVQQLENNLLVPKIMKDNVDVSPLVSIMSILIGFKLSGVIGALLAIPVYIVIRSVYSTWFKKLLVN